MARKDILSLYIPPIMCNCIILFVWDKELQQCLPISQTSRARCVRPVFSYFLWKKFNVEEIKKKRIVEEPFPIKWVEWVD